MNLQDTELQYIIDRLSEHYGLTSIAKELGYKYTTLYKHIKDNHPEIEISISRAKKSPNRKSSCKVNIDKDTLSDLYYNQKKTLGEIGKIYGCTPATILHYFRKNGIATRSKSDASKLMYETKPEVRERLRELANQGVTGIFSKTNYNDTWIEKAFVVWANINDLDVIRQFQITDIGHRYDFLIANTKILIECDGVFWHNTEKQKRKDEEFENLAAANGYKLFRFTDKEIKKTNMECFNILKKEIECKI